MSTALLAAVEQSIEESRQILDLAEALARLKSNRDFRKVLIDGFFKEEAVRLVQLKGSPDMQGDSEQKALIGQIDAIGALYQYFRRIEERAEIAGKSLDADEQTRQELLAENLQ